MVFLPVVEYRVCPIALAPVRLRPLIVIVVKPLGTRVADPVNVPVVSLIGRALIESADGSTFAYVPLTSITGEPVCAEGSGEVIAICGAPGRIT